MRRGDDLRSYLRLEDMPDVWCPGCGHGNVMTALVTAFDRLQTDLDRLVMVGGIGCASRMPFYINTNAMHTTHGRALAFATGVKLARPELTVLAVMGDGDALAIGGNHLIHACRRNIDLTALMLNNEIYGMTGGQLAPTTPTGFRTTTSTFGSIEPPFDAVELALAAGASFVARTTTFDFDEMPQLIEAAMRHRGFSFVEILSQCPTYFGRLNRLGEGRALLEHEKDQTAPVEDVTRDQLAGTLPTGVFRDEARPEYTRRYAELCARAAENGNGH
jgi:Pyruvate:ferredoxin oxidoreductase and related 2-oxoacid:ferredoxin oxidoreductases, beta subunit